MGLEKLAFAESQVGQMQVELKELQPQLVVAAEENEKMMKVSGKLAKIFWFKKDFFGDFEKHGQINLQAPFNLLREGMQIVIFGDSRLVTFYRPCVSLKCLLLILGQTHWYSLGILS